MAPLFVRRPTGASASSLAQEQPDQEGFFFEVFGQRIRLLFFKQENAVKLLLTAVLVLILLVLRCGARGLSRLLQRGVEREDVRFWTRQAINLAVAFLLLLGFLSIWFDDPTRLATGIGLVMAGLAFALQKVITAVAGYFVILRGDTFSVGDRITMGGVRGDAHQAGLHQDDDRGDGAAPVGAGRGARAVGEDPAVQRARRDGDERQRVRRGGLQLHA